ncbi:ABC transporter ATP-binding protein/permease [Pseudorhodoplanes sp.]|uniref:ABC transporter ATP-binding protein/permease n=1 Tax=Pseudorhodoplanes sp. TaxID=1934341 RepID=UPI002D087EC8|nr:ABC transporter ATP-binding protein/permease [Pseudorhodoplanes sp.]HWV40633.1 ABC transporter ATP-binding protein/permease [Pseudorhodoplanes sp.]
MSERNSTSSLPDRPASDRRGQDAPEHTVPEKTARPDRREDDASDVSLDDAAAEPEAPVSPDSDTDAEAEKEKLRRRALLGRFWSSARGFWNPREGDRLAWPLTIGVALLVILAVLAQYGINVWNRKIFDALEKRDSASVLTLALVFFPLAAASVGVGVASVYGRMSMQRRWRAWLSDHVLDRWLKNGRYYQLNLVSGDHQNPEGRLTEDLRVSTDAPIDFAVGVSTATLSALTFIAVLWTIGGALTVPLGGSAITIPGFLVIAAILYAVIASGAMAIVGRSFVAVSEAKNQAEADYRYNLTRVRENGESIALLGGEAEERAGLNRSFVEVLRKWRALCAQHMRTTVVSHGSGIIAPVLPIILCAPKFLDGSMSLGQVMQAASAFTIVQAAFAWLVDNYPRLAEWTAGARRISSLMVSVDALEKAETGEGINRIKRVESDDAAIRMKDLVVALDNGTAVVDDTDVVIKKGERVLVAGASGSGKSTLVRAISGLWPWGGGEIAVQRDSRLFLLPQRPYVPTGTLRRAIAYPGAAEDWDLNTIRDALDRVGLGHLKERVEEEAPWDQTLSGGEKQRLTVARVLLHRPDIIVLDEATAALDPKSQDALMKLLSEEMEGLTILSVGHRPELEQFHSRKLTLERRDSGGAKLVSDILLVRPPGQPRFMQRLLRRAKSGPDNSGTRKSGPEKKAA